MSRFNVSAQGQTLLSNFDIVAKVGANAADVESFSVTVTSQILHIALTPVVDNPMRFTSEDFCDLSAEERACQAIEQCGFMLQ